MICGASWILSFALSASLLLSVIVWGMHCVVPVDVYANRRISPLAASEAREQKHRVTEIARTFANGTMKHINQMALQSSPGKFNCQISSLDNNMSFTIDYSVSGPTSCLVERAKQDFRALLELHEQNMAGQLAEMVAFEIEKLPLFQFNHSPK